MTYAKINELALEAIELTAQYAAGDWGAEHRLRTAMRKLHEAVSLRKTQEGK